MPHHITAGRPAYASRCRPASVRSCKSHPWIVPYGPPCAPPPAGQYVVLSTDLGLEEIVEEDESTQQRVEAHARAFIQERFAPRLEAAKVG